MEMSERKKACGHHVLSLWCVPAPHPPPSPLHHLSPPPCQGGEGWMMGGADSPHHHPDPSDNVVNKESKRAGEQESNREHNEQKWKLVLPHHRIATATLRLTAFFK